MISYIANKYYWYRNYKTLHRFFQKYDSDKILLFGYPKSGNTWLRFLLYNYLSLLINPKLVSTISYNQLNEFQNNVMDRSTTFVPKEGFPFFYRTHKLYNKSYNLFDFKIFIHRNPLDTLVSSYYFYKQRKEPFENDKISFRKELHDINFYVKYKIDEWISFFDISVKKSDFIINYSDLKEDPLLFLSRLINRLGWDYKEDIVKKSITLSSFDNVKRMAKEKNQNYGNGPKDGSFFGVFNRSGTDGQYRDELDADTINFVLKRLPTFNELYTSS